MSKQPSGYIDHQGYAKQIERYLELTKKGAVIGITGVRGAGKSALMDELCHNIASNNKDYHVMQMTAPANHQQNMAFFISVCTSLCRSVKNKASAKLNDDQNPLRVEQNKITGRLLRFVTRNLFFIVAMVIAAVAIALAIFIDSADDSFDSFGLNQSSLEAQYYDPYYPNINILNSNSGHRLYLDNSHRLIDNLKQQEKATINDVISQIDNLLLTPKRTPKEDNQQNYYLGHGVAGLGFSLTTIEQNAPILLHLAQHLQSINQTINANITSRQNLEHKLSTLLSVPYVKLDYDLELENNATSIADMHLNKETIFLPQVWYYVHYVLADGIKPKFEPLSPFKHNLPSPNILTLLYSHITVTAYESQLDNASKKTTEVQSINHLAQQLRALLNVNNQKVAHDSSKRPAHFLPAWIINEALVTQATQASGDFNNHTTTNIELNHSQLIQLKALLQQYEKLLNLTFKSLEDKKTKVETKVFNKLSQQHIYSIVLSLFWLLMTIALIPILSFRFKSLNRPILVLTASVISALSYLLFTFTILFIDSLISYNINNANVVVLYVAFPLLLIFANKNARFKLLHFIKHTPEQLALKSQIRISKVFLDELEHHSETQYYGEIGHSKFKTGKNKLKKQRPLNLPVLTAKFKQYCANLIDIAEDKECKIIIAIDELDKIHAIEEVKLLLSDIKGALALPNVYFLLTISEDCSDSFKQRLAKGRDIFESSFDDIFYVKRINDQAVIKLANTLNPEDTPNLQICLLVYLVSGGVPREVKRTLKLLYSKGETLQHISQVKVIAMILEQAWFDWSLELLDIKVSSNKMDHLHQYSTQALAIIKQLTTASSNENSQQEMLLSLLDKTDSSIEEIKTLTGNNLATLIKLKILVLVSIDQLKTQEKLQDDSQEDLNDKHELSEKNQQVIEAFGLLNKQPLLAKRLIEQTFAELV